jgi:hypothetical protein
MDETFENEDNDCSRDDPERKLFDVVVVVVVAVVVCAEGNG